VPVFEGQLWIVACAATVRRQLVVVLLEQLACDDALRGVYMAIELVQAHGSGILLRLLASNPPGQNVPEGH
jgi:hypothetical protein